MKSSKFQRIVLDVSTRFDCEISIEAKGERMDSEFRDLNKDEIIALPVELRACYVVLGWNKSFSPKSKKDWAKKFWVMWSAGSGMSELSTIEEMILDQEETERLLRLWS